MTDAEPATGVSRYDDSNEAEDAGSLYVCVYIDIYILPRFPWGLARL